jgi:hypothetical protein
LLGGYSNNQEGDMKIAIWIMILGQLVAWGWFSAKGGTLKDKPFLVFTVLMMLGQLGAGIETFQKAAWGAFTVQAYFLCFTAIGGIKRLSQMRSNSSLSDMESK